MKLRHFLARVSLVLTASVALPALAAEKPKRLLIIGSLGAEKLPM